jgi:hypothetical protein
MCFGLLFAVKYPRDVLPEAIPLLEMPRYLEGLVEDGAP